MSRRTAAVLLGSFWTILLAAVAWYAARPAAERDALAARDAELRSAAGRVAALAEGMLNDRTAATARAGRAIAERPGEAPALLHALLAEHPGLLDARVHSPEAADEAEVRRDSGAAAVADSAWAPYRTADSVLVVWDGTAPGDFFRLATRSAFRIRDHRFFLTLLWDEQEFRRTLDRAPSPSGALLRIDGPSGRIWAGPGTETPSGPRDTIRRSLETLDATVVVSASSDEVTGPIRRGLLILFAAAFGFVIVPAAFLIGRRR